MRHWGEHALGKERGGGLDIFFLTGGAEPAGFAGESEQEFVLTVVAVDSGKAPLEITAVREFANDLGDDGTDRSHQGLVLVRVDEEELFEMAINALPERRFARVAGAVEFHRCPGDRGAAWELLCGTLCSGHAFGHLKQSVNPENGN